MEFSKDEITIIKAALKNSKILPDIKEKLENADYFEDEDKVLIKEALTTHLDEVKNVEGFPNQSVGMLATEKKYEELVEELMKKFE